MAERIRVPFRHDVHRPDQPPAWMEPLETRVLLSDWWIAGHFGGADWVAGIGGGFTGAGLTITGSYRSDDWAVDAHVGAGPAAGDPSPPPTAPVAAPAARAIGAAVAAAGDGSPLRMNIAATLAGGQADGAITIQWTGGEPQAAMDVWRLGPDGWQLEGEAVDAAKGRFEWLPWKGPEGWQAFATVDGGRVTLTAPTLSRGPVALEDLVDWDPGQPVALRASGGLTVVDRALAAEIRIEWDAWDRPAEPPMIALWDRDPRGMWHRLTGEGGISAAEGSFTWNTSSARAGWHGVWATLAGADAPVFAATDLAVQIL